MVNIIHKKPWKSLFKSPIENIIYKIIYSKCYLSLLNIMRNYTKLFKAHGN